jgi:hypothetical protein
VKDHPGIPGWDPLHRKVHTLRERKREREKEKERKVRMRE